jgi:hypothetical protein
MNPNPNTDILQVRVEQTYAAMPKTISDAIFGRAPAAPEEPNPDFIPAANPWLAKPGIDGVLQYEDPDREDRALSTSVAHVAAMFTPKPAKAAAPDLSNLPFFPSTIQHDSSESEFYRALLPIEKLFHPSAATSTTLAKRDDDEEDVPTPARTPTKDFEQIRADIFAAYELKMAKLAKSPVDDSEEFSLELQNLITEIISGLEDQGDDESDEDFDKRIARGLNTELARRGHRPILNY